MSTNENDTSSLAAELQQIGSDLRARATIEDESAEQAAFDRAYTLNKRHDRMLYRALIEDFIVAIQQQPLLARQFAEQIVKLGFGEIIRTLADELQKRQEAQKKTP